MIAVTAQNFIDENNVEKFRKLADELIENTRKEKGCIEYSLFRDRNNKDNFCFVEKWESVEDLKAHFKSEHFMRIVPEIEKIKMKKDIVSVYDEVI